MKKTQHRDQKENHHSSGRQGHSDAIKKAKKLIAELYWEANDLTYKLKASQKKILSSILATKGFKYVLRCSRRLGKTYLLCCIAIEMCCKKPNTMVRYAAPTHKALKKFIIPVMRRILEDCPFRESVQFIKSDGVFTFPNGSEIHLAGVNNDNADSLRGTHADLFIVDEAGEVDDLKYLLNDVAMPQFLDPDGRVVEERKLLISGTPARTPAHEFTEVCREAYAKGALSHYDIYEAGYPQSVINMIIEECGGVDSTTWKREYLALEVVDENYALCPEWNPSFVGEPIRDECLPYYHKYDALDIGVRDLTVALFAHYDFLRAKLYVHAEFVLSGPEMRTDKLAEGVLRLERELFSEMKIHKRVSDIDLLLLNDLRALHKLYFSPTDKGSLEEMVNHVRLWVSQGKIIISPRCTNLIGCMQYGIWNEKREDFERIPPYGHFDAFAALMYLVRNVDVHTNPIPAAHGKSAADTWFEVDELKNKKHATLKKAFGGGR